MEQLAEKEKQERLEKAGEEEEFEEGESTS